MTIEVSEAEFVFFKHGRWSNQRRDLPIFGEASPLEFLRSPLLRSHPFSFSPTRFLVFRSCCYRWNLRHVVIDVEVYDDDDGRCCDTLRMMMLALLCCWRLKRWRVGSCDEDDENIVMKSVKWWWLEIGKGLKFC